MGHKRLEQLKKKFVKDNQKLLLLDGALKKLVDLEVATVYGDKYVYSQLFAGTVHNIVSSPPGKLTQIKLANEAGHKLIPQILTMTTTKTTRHDIENMLVAYVCLKTHIDEHKLAVDKKLLPDLTYAVWYLNDHEPTLKEVEEWTLQKK
jgi:hypothetical protein